MQMPPPLPRLKPSPAAPAKIIEELLGKCGRGDLPRARKIAERIRDPAYGLKAYYDDIQAAFPELRLYHLQPPAAAEGGRGTSKKGPKGGDAAGGMTTSGIAGEQEFKRTVGAFFAVYWLMRIGIDGERGFSFGVDDDAWTPLTLEQVGARSGGQAASHDRWR